VKHIARNVIVALRKRQVPFNKGLLEAMIKVRCVRMHLQQANECALRSKLVMQMGAAGSRPGEIGAAVPPPLKDLYKNMLECVCKKENIVTPGVTSKEHDEGWLLCTIDVHNDAIAILQEDIRERERSAQKRAEDAFAEAHRLREDRRKAIEDGKKVGKPQDLISEEDIEHVVNKFHNGERASFLKHRKDLTVCSTKPAAAVAVNHIAAALQSKIASKHIHVDTEWSRFKGRQRTGHDHGVDMLQIALSDRSVYLFHIACMEGKTPTAKMPIQLKNLLESENTTCIGSCIKSADFNRLRGNGVRTTRMVNLAAMAKELKDIPAAQFSLARLLNLYCPNRELDKSGGQTDEKVQWHVKRLSKKQRDYARDDVLASLDIYDAMAKKMPSGDSCSHVHKHTRTHRHKQSTHTHTHTYTHLM
jgi:ribonuclease D